MCAGALLLLFVAIVPSAIAKQKPETPADSLTVVAQFASAQSFGEPDFPAGTRHKQ
jgi:hypothetical protein